MIIKAKNLNNCFISLCYRHERSIHPEEHLLGSEELQKVEEQKPRCKQDYVYNYLTYHTSRLRFGLIHLYIIDAIHEGDGQRLFAILPYILLLFHLYKRTKYAYVTLLHLVKAVALLPSGLANELVHDRFWNTKGGAGNNIPLDLRMEHMVRLFKLSLKQLGANVSEVGAQRIAQSLGHLEDLLRQTDQDCDMTQASGYHSSKHLKEVVLQIANDLNSMTPFKHTPGRCHPSFPKFPGNLLERLDFTELYSWISRLLKIWSAVYERN